MATLSIHNVTRIEPGQIRQLDGFCTRTLAVWTKPLGSPAEQAEEVVLFGANIDALWLGHAVEDPKPVQIVQASLVGVPERIAKLERELAAARRGIEQYGRALAQIANVGCGRGALSEAIRIAEDTVGGEDLDYYTSLNAAEDAA